MAAAEQGKFESSTAKTAMLRRYSSRFDSAMRMTTTTKFVLMVVVMVCAMHVRETAGEACGRRLKYLTAADSMALLTSPSYPNDYENNEHCQWVLTAPEGFRDPIVQLESVATDLVNWDNGDCEDYLAVYDGLDSTKPLLKKWCGKEKAVIRSSGKTVLVVFHTDSHLTSRGFALKYYSMQKYSSKCDPERTVNLETSFNPIFVDLPSYTGIDNAPERVQCRYLFTSNENDRGLVLTLELHSAIECEDGNFTIYDGPSESSPKIVSWCYGTKPFEAITTHSSQALVTFTLLRPDLSWHVLRLRAVTRSLQTGCSDNIIPTVQVSSEPTFISFPYTTIVRGNTPCSLRLWASGRYQTLKLDLVNSTKSDLQCGDRGLEFFDGYMKDKAKSLGEACKKTTMRSLTHNMVISPGPSFPSDKPILLRVVALDYPCNNNTERRRAESDKIETLPSLSTNTSGFPNDAQCRYLLSAFRVVDAVEVEVQGRMVPRGDATCKGDYIAFYDGKSDVTT
ncbi:cubilin-like [Littorina saxatilis]|uniref:cubilin-like n=1 Tax=Littorina saxatilis TaxID=31220 RepID=UPI0038B5936F